MLTAEQVRFFDTFGFVVLRDVFSADELKTIRREFDHRAAVASSYEPFDGTTRHNMRMKGADTPFFASLLEDPRFAEAAEQMFGEVIGSSVDADRYTADSAWHYDAGGADAQGVKFAFYLQPVRADTGALRVIPGSHRREWFDELYEYEPIGPRWTRAAASPEETQLAMDGIDAIPAYACESDPGDVVAFDLRIYHASLGGSNDRHMCSLVYYKYPSTPEELELITLNVKGHMARRDNAGDPWNPPSVDEDWMANRQGSPRRKLWIDRLHELNKMPTGQNGVKAVAVNGKWKLVPA